MYTRDQWYRKRVKASYAVLYYSNVYLLVYIWIQINSVARRQHFHWFLQNLLYLHQWTVTNLLVASYWTLGRPGTCKYNHHLTLDDFHIGVKFWTIIIFNSLDLLNVVDKSIQYHFLLQKHVQVVSQCALLRCSRSTFCSAVTCHCACLVLP